MGRKKGNKGKSEGASNSALGSQSSITLRQEKTGKVKSKPPKLFSNLYHLEKLAVWASERASMPSLAAFYGQRFAALAESLGIAPHSHLFPCQRCETMLQPGSNCSVRIEKNEAKRRRRRNKCSGMTQNNVVYHCHYCSFRNIKRGTPKGHMKAICPPKPKACGESKPLESRSKKECRKSMDERAAAHTTREVPSPATVPAGTGDILPVETVAPATPAGSTGGILAIGTPATLPTETGTTLLKSKKKRKRKKGVPSPASVPATTGDILTVETDAPAAPPGGSGGILAIDTLATLPSETGMTLLNSKQKKRKKRKKKKGVPSPATVPASTGDILPVETDAPATPLVMTGGILAINTPETLPAETGTILLDSKKKRKRKRKRSKKQTEPENSSAPTDGEKPAGPSKRRRKKSWTSLKEIAQTEEQSGKLDASGLAIPFSLQGTF